MGIDARMLVKIRGTENWLSSDQVSRLAYDAAEAFGHENFLIIDDPRWPRRAIEIVKSLASEDIDDSYAELAGKVVMFQDGGPPIVAEADEQFLRLSLYGSYYGQGYERGDLPFTIMLARWLEFRLPKGDIHYGGDCGGTRIEPFDEAVRTELFTHFVNVGHKPYFGVFSSALGGRNLMICDFCGGMPMNNIGGSGNRSFHFCPGCGKRALTDRGGGQVIRFLEPDEDWFRAVIS